MPPREITLGTMCDGAAAELFQRSLARVLKNIDDPSTEAKAPRSITMKFKFMPDKDRRSARMVVACGEALAGVAASEHSVLIGQHEGRLVAAEALRQEDMFDQPHGKPQAVAVNDDGGGE